MNLKQLLTRGAYNALKKPHLKNKKSRSCYALRSTCESVNAEINAKDMSHDCCSSEVEVMEKNEKSMKVFLSKARQVMSGKPKPKVVKSFDGGKPLLQQSPTVMYNCLQRNGVHMLQHYLCSKGNVDDESP